MKKLLIVLCSYCILCCSICVYGKQSSLTMPHSITPTAELHRLTNAIAAIHHYYIRRVDNRDLFDSAISGMLSQLDPHSAYLNEEDLKELKMISSGKLQGIGVTILPKHSALEVITPIDNSPAQKAGIKAGDLIIRINKKLVTKIKPSTAIKLLRGKTGSKVTIYILRKGEPAPLKFKLTRALIKIKMVKGKLLENHYGYIRIALFNKTTPDELIKALNQLKKESNNNLYGVILDLRNNPGGILQSSVKVVDIFIDASTAKKNGLVVYTKGYPNNKKNNYYAKNKTAAPKIPLVVLINEGSASAAEIVAGALQDHKRAVLLGAKSFGKGSVQAVMPLDKKSAIKITTALYYTPNDRVIQAKGINPDVVVADLVIPKEKTDTILITPFTEANLHNHIKNGTKDKTTTISKKDSELIYKDFQLHEALNLLKGISALRYPSLQK